MSTGKTCTKCGVWKSYDLYSKDKSKKDGHTSACKECNKKTFKKAYERNGAKYRERTAEWSEENPEKVAEHQRQYKKTHPKKIAEITARYQKKNPEKVAERQKQYRERHPERVAESQRRQRNKKKAEREGGESE